MNDVRPRMKRKEYRVFRYLRYRKHGNMTNRTCSTESNTIPTNAVLLFSPRLWFMRKKGRKKKIDAFDAIQRVAEFLSAALIHALRRIPDYSRAYPRINIYPRNAKKKKKKRNGHTYSAIRLKPVSGSASPLALVLIPLVERLSRISTRSTRHFAWFTSRHGGTRRRRGTRFCGAGETVVKAQWRFVAKQREFGQCHLLRKIVRWTFHRLERS